MPENIAFLFPGQGSQFVGMGKDLADEFPEVKEIFGMLDEVCGKTISKLCFEGPIDELTLTVNLQPAITAVNLACLTVLNKSGISPEVSAGHSLGEYGALAAANVITLYDCLNLVRKRGELMHRESMFNPGGMTAVIGMDIKTVADIVASAQEKGVLAIANHNSEQQIVITGEESALSYAADLVKEKRGKAIPLKVSGAWHCSLMKDAVDDFREFMEDITFSSPLTSVLFNATADEEKDPEKIKDIMALQLTSPVKWYDIILRMLEQKVDIFVEVGPKKVLTGLLGKIIPRENGTRVYNVEDLKSLEGFLGELS